MAPYIREKSLQKKIINTQKNKHKDITTSVCHESKEDGDSFGSLEGLVLEGTLKAIQEMGFSTMTEIQSKAIPKLLEWKNLRATAKTGSGKTLAFLIPLIELIARLKFKPRNGTGAIIISPTRELSMQTYGVLNDLMKYHRQTTGLIMGGTNRKTEAEKLSKGINILVATPGRLLDHLKNSEFFNVKNLSCLVIDEADRILDFGFLDEMKQIAQLIPETRQTMLFSATKDERTLGLSRVFIPSEPIEIDIQKNNEEVTADNLEQAYVILPTEKRFLVLYNFIKKNFKKKVMVFFSSVASVSFYSTLLNYISVPVMCIHGKQKHTKRSSTFHRFSNLESGILLCTNIAARGWDIPAVDWIVQYDPPDDPKEYIHRVGRTARAGWKGRALLFLTETESSFIRFLNLHKVNIDPMEISWDKIQHVQAELEQVVNPNPHLRNEAKEAFAGYIRSYDAHSLKGIFDVQKLDYDKVAKCFCLNKTPSISLGKKDTSRKNNTNNFHSKRKSTTNDQSMDEQEFKSNKRKIFDD